jgi:hypothetical protein
VLSCLVGAQHDFYDALFQSHFLIEHPAHLGLRQEETGKSGLGDLCRDGFVLPIAQALCDVSGRQAQCPFDLVDGHVDGQSGSEIFGLNIRPLTGIQRREQQELSEHK